MFKRGINRLRGWPAISILFVLGLMSSAGWAADDGHAHATAVGGAPVEASGLRVYRDPVTGRFGPPPAVTPPPELSISEQARLNRSDRGLQARRLPNGAVAVDLQGRFQSMAVVASDATGKPAVNCTLTPTEANAVLQGAAATKTTTEQ